MEASRNPFMVEIWSAVWRHRKGLLFVAGLSLAVLVLIALIVGLCVPKNVSYKQDAFVFLPKNSKGAFHYPNERLFSPNDVISPEILHKVYNDNHFQDNIDYEDFAELFTFTNVMKEKQFLDQRYEKALQRRNITGVEIKELEQDYQQELAKLDQGLFCLSFRKSRLIPEDTAASLPLQVLQTWKTIYQRQNGRMPLTAVVSDLERKLNAEFRNSPLIAVDRASYFRHQMLELCKTLKKLLGMRVVTLSDTGESLEDVVENLTYIQSYQLNVLMQMIIEDQALQGPLDDFFISGKIHGLERTLTEVEGAQKSAGEGLAKLEYYGSNSSTTAGKGKSDDAGGGSQLNFDASFFMQLASLIRNDAMNEPRAKLANQYSELGIEVAKLKSDVEYYRNLREQLRKSAVNKANAQVFSALFKTMVDGLVQTNNLLERFKRMILDNEFSASRFYLPSGPTYRIQTAVVSWKILAVVTLLIWLLINLCSLAVVSLEVFRPEKKN